jgi:hypothetical protein
MTLLTVKQKAKRIHEICDSMCPVCDKKEIEAVTIQACDETDTLVDYDVIFHIVLAKLDICEKCQFKEESYEE